MKKAAYLAAIAVCGVLIILLLLSMILSPILQSRDQKLIVGTWFDDAFNGNGGKYATFHENGTVELYEEVTAADGTVIYQDSKDFGTMTYEVLKGGKLQLTVNVMGAASEEVIDFKIQGSDTLILGEDVYVRR